MAVVLVRQPAFVTWTKVSSGAPCRLNGKPTVSNLSLIQTIESICASLSTAMDGVNQIARGIVLCCMLAFMLCPANAQEKPQKIVLAIHTTPQGNALYIEAKLKGKPATLL